MKHLLAALILGLALGAVARAAEQTDVARVSAIAHGSVIVQRGDATTQTAAVVNAPLLPGDYVLTGPGTQAEIQLDGYVAIRLGENVQLRIVNDDAQLRAVQLAAGTVILSIAHGESGQAEIESPSANLTATAVGDYRISVDSDGATIATARSGNARLATADATYDLAPGKSLVVSGSADHPSAVYEPEIAADALDAWSAARNRVTDAALNTDTYLPAGLAGYDDFNSYGRWLDVQPYGMVWSPYADPGWAPYRYGSWVWNDGFGWTWIAAEPWGWAPFHYGRWFVCQPYGWCWYPPGAYAATWYPALVGFFGFGSYIDYTYGFGYWGWVPLAPWETYYPWYPGWGGWHTHPYPLPPYPLPPPPTPRPPHPPNPRPPGPPHVVNPTPHPPNPRKPGPPHVTGPPPHMEPVHGSGVPGAYRNMRYGATGVTGTEFRAGNFTHPVTIDPTQLKSITTLRGTLPLAPTTANLNFAHGAPPKRIPLSHTFATPRFSTERGLPVRAQFPAQRAQVHETLKATAPKLTPGKPQTPPASEAWRRFESTRVHVTIPSAPQPRQYPVTTPIHVTPPAAHPPVLSPPAGHPPVAAPPPPARPPVVTPPRPLPAPPSAPRKPPAKR